MLCESGFATFKETSLRKLSDADAQLYYSIVVLLLENSNSWYICILSISNKPVNMKYRVFYNIPIFLSLIIFWVFLFRVHFFAKTACWSLKITLKSHFLRVLSSISIQIVMKYTISEITIITIFCNDITLYWPSTAAGYLSIIRIFYQQGIKYLHKKSTPPKGGADRYRFGQSIACGYTAVIAYRLFAAARAAS